MPHRDVHWPWAPVIIGSVLILLSIMMRMYEFDPAFINLVASAGDIVVIFSLLYIIKIFLIDETPLPAGALSPAMGPAMTSAARPLSIPRSFPTQRPPAPSRLLQLLQFSVINVDEQNARITVQAELSANDISPLSVGQATLELMKLQNDVKEVIKDWARTQHGESFIVNAVDTVSITPTLVGGLAVSSKYTLQSR